MEASRSLSKVCGSFENSLEDLGKLLESWGRSSRSFSKLPQYFPRLLEASPELAQAKIRGGVLEKTDFEPFRGETCVPEGPLNSNSRDKDKMASLIFSKKTPVRKGFRLKKK